MKTTHRTLCLADAWIEALASIRAMRLSAAESDRVLRAYQVVLDQWSLKAESSATFDPADTQYRQRIAHLQAIAGEEGITFSHDSAQDFRQFTTECRPVPQAGLILTDDGNIVAVWRDADGGTLEVEFQGSQQCKTVVFKEPEKPLRSLPEISVSTLDAAVQFVSERLPHREPEPASFRRLHVFDDTSFIVGEASTRRGQTPKARNWRYHKPVQDSPPMFSLVTLEILSTIMAVAFNRNPGLVQELADKHNLRE